MAFIPVPNCAKVAMSFTVATSHHMVNTYGAFNQVGTPFTASQLSDLAAEFVNLWDTGLSAGNPLKQFFTADVVLDQVEAIALDSVTSPGSIVAAGVAGTRAASELLPPQTSVVVTLLTALRGRSFRGRVYMPPWTEADQNGGLITTAAQAGLTAVFGNLITALDAVATPLSIISRFSGVDATGHPIPRAAGIATSVNAARTNQALKTQRRRAA